jgi:hypothetical protein
MRHLNYIREAENYLYYYRDMKKSLDQLEKQINKLISKAGPHDLKAMTFDQTGIRHSQQDEAINILFQLQKLIENREKTEEKLKKIDELLDSISQDEGCELYGTVLRKWYIERIPKEEIAEEIGYSSRTSIYTIRARAIRKLAVRLFGIGMVEDL